MRSSGLCIDALPFMDGNILYRLLKPTQCAVALPPVTLQPPHFEVYLLGLQACLPSRFMPRQRNEEFASKFQSILDDRNITLRDLAHSTGLSLASLHAFKAGTRYPTNKMARRIAKALDIDVRKLFIASQVPPRSKGPLPEADFDIHFDPAFEPADVKELITALANYYRACGGAGFELDIEHQEAYVREPVHV